MFRANDQTAHDRVIVNVVDLLEHHFIRFDLLRMNAFLPDLMLLVLLVRRAVIGELVDQPLPLFQPNLREQGMRGEALEMAQCGGQVGAGEDGVKVVLHDDPGMDPKLTLFTAVEQGVDEDVAAGRGGEDGEPFHDG